MALPLASAQLATAAKARKTTKKAAAKKATTKKASPATTRPTPGATAPGRSIPDHPVQGVTKDTIKVGLALSTATSTTADYRATYDALIKYYKDEGKLPVHGRDIRFSQFQIQAGTGPADLAASQRQGCVQLANKDKVFIGMGHSGVTPTAQCMTAEFRVPFLGAAGFSPTDEELAAGYPFLFWDNMTSSRVLRNWPSWAKDQGFLSANAKIGTLVTDDPVFRSDFEKNFKSSLGKLGYRVGTEAFYKDAASVPGAVQRFKSAGVDVIFLGSGAAFVALAQELDKQNFRPDVLLTDWDTSASTASIPRDLPDRFTASAMTYYHRAEDGLSSNPPEPAQVKPCMDAIAKYSGRRLVPTSGGRPTADYAEYQQMMHMCDLVQILVDALQKAGPDLTTESLIAGLEQTKDVDHGQISPISFDRTNHDGPQNFKTLAWDYNCDCWKHVSGFRPAFVK